MKSGIKLMLLILLTLTNLNGSSQIDTKIPFQDSTKIQLTKPIARLVIKDLIEGDGAKEEVLILGSKIKLLTQKISFKDSIIFSLNSKILNSNLLSQTQSQQLILSQSLNKKLAKDLKRQKFKSRLIGGTGVIVLIGVILLTN